MGAIAIHHTKVDKESSWDGPAEVSAAPNDEKTLTYMHAWFEDGAKRDAKSTYKDPHHPNGTDTPANLRGINNALARLPGTDIPENQKPGTEKHLRAHRTDAGLEATMNENEITAAVEHIAKVEDLKASEKRRMLAIVKLHEADAQAMLAIQAGNGVGKTALRPYVLRAFVQTPWAILPEKLAVLEEIVMRHALGEKLNAEEVQARIHGASRPEPRTVHQDGQSQVNTVAVLPLFGTIFPRGNLMTQVSGATSAETFGKQFAALLEDPKVDAIVLDVDSPGGNIQGIEEVSKQIYDARGTKPIVAVANHTMASAAYWIGSAADEVVTTPSGEVGSIGVFTVHEDVSAALAQEGVKLTLVQAGKYKTEGNPYEPLSEEGKAYYQEQVNQAYENFVAAVARNRGVSAETVKADFGEGRMAGAAQAIEKGMADSVGTLDGTIARILQLTTAPKMGAGKAEIINPDALLVNEQSNASQAQPVPDEEIRRQFESLRLEIQKYL
jgi:signal peptide peptidase SppA